MPITENSYHKHNMNCWKYKNMKKGLSRVKSFWLISRIFRTDIYNCYLEILLKSVAIQKKSTLLN